MTSYFTIKLNPILASFKLFDEFNDHMMIRCRNCKKIFYAKNAIFCSTACYKFYSVALERNEITPFENIPNEKLNDFVVQYNQINCKHEYSKNGTMSCRKCGYTNIS